jgi:hypothetical protein
VNTNTSATGNFRYARYEYHSHFKLETNCPSGRCSVDRNHRRLQRRRRRSNGNGRSNRIGLAHRGPDSSNRNFRPGSANGCANRSTRTNSNRSPGANCGTSADCNRNDGTANGNRHSTYRNGNEHTGTNADAKRVRSNLPGLQFPRILRRLRRNTRLHNHRQNSRRRLRHHRRYR